MTIEGLFFELLQVAVGNRSSLSRVPMAREWGELYNMATRQALTGVCFVALQRLKSAGAVVIPEVLWLKWLGMAAKIQQRNQVMNEEVVQKCWCRDECRRAREDASAYKFI